MQSFIGSRHWDIGLGRDSWSGTLRPSFPLLSFPYFCIVAEGMRRHCGRTICTGELNGIVAQVFP